ncbi:MAG TPA: LacI family DNA-binding transcriptional regulator [Candidatus Merdenecus merdavium]|nr:LacI family DNA-binding transcriptional regulator [Candidatus Merdenecus merdavium]
MAGIRDVAKIAGVSASTVSRVMNGTAHVDEEKKLRVLAAIKETNFRPNELARSLYKKSSKMIGVILPTMENPFFTELAKDIEEAAYDHSYRFALCNSNHDYHKEKNNIRTMTQLNADGMILMSNHEKVWKEVKECNIPVVIMDRQLRDHKELAYIGSNHYEGGKLAAKHMIECGCKYLVHMRGSQVLSSARQRLQGCLDVCKESHIPMDVVDCGYEYHDGIQAICEILERYPKVDGILASNDVTALAAYKVLKNKGYDIPRDIQLMGYDNTNISSMVTPEITTIAQQTKAMGRLAVEIIVNHINQVPFKKETIFDVSLIERETTKK